MNHQTKRGIIIILYTTTILVSKHLIIVTGGVKLHLLPQKKKNPGKRWKFYWNVHDVFTEQKQERHNYWNGIKRKGSYH